MFASPFFTSGRAAILPTIATKEELHTANSLTQTTQWTTLAIGAFLGGTSVTQFGYKWAFVVNALSFLVSAFCISRLLLPGRGFRRRARALTEAEVVRPWHEYTEGLRYMRSRAADPRASADRASAGPPAAARRRFCSASSANWSSIAAPPGIGMIWGCAGIGLLIGGAIAYTLGRRLSFHELQAHHRDLLHRPRRRRTSSSARCAISAGRWSSSRSRAPAWGSVRVLNMSQLLRIVADDFRGRVFATMESMQWSVMMLSMAAGRDRVAVLGSAHHRRDRRRAQFHHRDILGLGAFHRPAAGAGSAKAWSRRRSKSMANPARTRRVRADGSLGSGQVPSPTQSHPRHRRRQAHRARHRAAPRRRKARASPSTITAPKTKPAAPPRSAAAPSSSAPIWKAWPRSDRMFAEVEQRLGRLDGLVNNAARFTRFDPLEITEKDWDFIHSVNLKAVFFCCQQAARIMKRQGGGRIVNISSLGGIRPWAEHAHYCASKAGVIMLTRALAKAFAPEITVNSVAPGVIPFDDIDERGKRMIEYTPAKRGGTPAEIADAVVYFLNVSNFVTGQVLAVDGGLSQR